MTEQLPGPARWRLVVADMAGTTVVDDGLVMGAFADAFAAIGLDPTPDQRAYVAATMGRSKIDVFTELLADAARAEQANAAFEAACAARVAAGEVRPIPGAREAIERLRDAGVAVWLTTGFSAATQAQLMDRLAWRGLVDGWLSPTAAWRGRPHPDLVWVAALHQHVDDIRHVAVVGDTTNDLVSGWRSGAAEVIGVLTGAHDRAALEQAPHTAILGSIIDVPDHLGLP